MANIKAPQRNLSAIIIVLIALVSFTQIEAGAFAGPGQQEAQYTPIEVPPHIDTTDGTSLSPEEAAALFEEPEVPEELEGMTFLTSGQTFNWRNMDESQIPAWLDAVCPDYTTGDGVSVGDIDFELVAQSYVPDEIAGVFYEVIADIRAQVDIDIPETAIHRVHIKMQNFGNSSILAGASGAWFSDSQTGNIVPAVLLDTQTQTNNTSGYSINVVINSGQTWDMSCDPDESVSNGQYYLKSILSHEILHGLGISNQNNSVWNNNLYHDQNLNEHVNDNSSYKTSGDVWFQNSDGTWERAYAPSSFANGSSLSHLNEGTYAYIRNFISIPGAVITPFQTTNEVTQMDPVVAGLLQRLGYATHGQTVENPSIAFDSSTGNLTITPGENGAYIPAFEWEIQVDNGSNITTTVIPGTQHVFNISETSGVVTVRGLSHTNTPGVATLAFSQGGGTTTTTQPPTTTTEPPTTTTQPPTTTTEPPTTTTQPPTTTTEPPAPTTTEPPTTTTTPTTQPAPAAEPPAPAYPAAPSPEGIFNSLDVRQPNYSPNPVGSQVWRLYSAFFLRQPDQSGFEYWLSIRNDHGHANIAWSFSTSAEFQNRYGSLSNREYIRMVYVNVMGREPDQAGYDYWLGLMSSGEVNRGQLMIYFSESNEYMNKTNTTDSLFS